MNPWFIATEKFGPSKGEAWRKYLTWSGLAHLQELVSLDPILCPPILSAIREDYWPHIVNENFMLSYFVDLASYWQRFRTSLKKMFCVSFAIPSLNPGHRYILPTAAFSGMTSLMLKEAQVLFPTVVAFRRFSHRPNFPPTAS